MTVIRSLGSMILIGLLLALHSVAGVYASGFRCVATDVTGDSAFGGITGQPYEDIARAEIAKMGGTFVFGMDMAADIPESPPLLPPGVALIQWIWGMDTDPAAFPTGFPLAPGFSRPTEFVVQLTWDGLGFQGELIDSRPVLTGGDTLVTPVRFKIKGASIRVFIDAASLGDPSLFGWGAATQTWASQLGTLAFIPLDHAPEVPPATCPE